MNKDPFIFEYSRVDFHCIHTIHTNSYNFISIFDDGFYPHFYFNHFSRLIEHTKSRFDDLISDEKQIDIFHLCEECVCIGYWKSCYSFHRHFIIETMWKMEISKEYGWRDILV